MTGFGPSICEETQGCLCPCFVGARLQDKMSLMTYYFDSQFFGAISSVFFGGPIDHGNHGGRR